MKCLLPLLLSFIAIACVRQQPESAKPALEGAYLGQSPPGDTAEVFAPEILSGQWEERDLAISPKGDELYYTLVSPGKDYQVIVGRKLVANQWSEPQVAPFSGRYPDLEPAFSPDGTRLFFASKRPLTGDSAPKDWDIWYVDRTSSGWSVPVNVGEPVNTGRDEFFPSVSSAGHLYFTATRDEGIGREDLYKSSWNGEQFEAPQNLGPNINSATYEFNAFIAPDEQYLIFSSFGREDGQGGGDLYISYRDEAGEWQVARNMGPKVNSAQLDYCPFVSHDGAYFFFTSQKKTADIGTAPRSYQQVIDYFTSSENGNSNLYWIRFSVVD